MRKNWGLFSDGSYRIGYTNAGCGPLVIALGGKQIDSVIPDEIKKDPLGFVKKGEPILNHQVQVGDRYFLLNFAGFESLNTFNISGEDITSLVMERERAKLAPDNNPNMMFQSRLVNGDLDFFYANPASMNQLLGPDKNKQDLAEFLPSMLKDPDNQKAFIEQERVFEYPKKIGDRIYKCRLVGINVGNNWGQFMYFYVDDVTEDERNKEDATLLADLSPIPIYRFNISDDKLNLIYANEACARVFGLSLVGLKDDERLEVYSQMLPKLIDMLPEELQTESGANIDYIRKNIANQSMLPDIEKTVDDRVYNCNLIGVRKYGYLQGYLNNVTALKRAHEELKRKADHDGLTGLPNRGLFESKLSDAIKQAQRESNKQVSVLFFDLDHFKEANDVYGHQAGDFVLVESAQRMQAEVRDVDTVARFGGDEFAAILISEKTSNVKEDVGGVAEKIRLSINRPYEKLFMAGDLITTLEGELSKLRKGEIDARDGKMTQDEIDQMIKTKQERIVELREMISRNGSDAQITVSIPIGCSIGVALMQGGDNVDTLLKKADQAMYVVKKGGRNWVYFFGDDPMKKSGGGVSINARQV